MVQLDQHLKKKQLLRIFIDIDIINNGYGDVTITEILEDIDNRKKVNFYTDVGSRLDITNPRNIHRRLFANK